MSGMTAIAFTECRDAHIGDVRDFFKRVYGAEYILARDERLFRWQFTGMVATDSYHLTLATVNGRIAGCLGFLPVEASIAGRTLRAAWTANWIVAPECRQLALGPRLMQHLLRRHDLTLVVGASVQALQILPRLGFTYFGTLVRSICVLDWTGLEQLLGHPIPHARRDVGTLKTHPTTTVTRVERFDESIEACWEATPTVIAGTRRSAAYLNWRYTAHPIFEYRRFVAFSNRAPAGFAVYRIERVAETSLAVGRLVELLAVNGAERSLLAAIHAEASREQLVLLDFYCSNRGLTISLRDVGWLFEAEQPATIPMLFQPIVPARRSIPFLAYPAHGLSLPPLDKWYVTKGDGDQDRPN